MIAPTQFELGDEAQLVFTGRLGVTKAQDGLRGQITQMFSRPGCYMVTIAGIGRRHIQGDHLRLVQKRWKG